MNVRYFSGVHSLLIYLSECTPLYNVAFAKYFRSWRILVEKDLYDDKYLYRLTSKGEELVTKFKRSIPTRIGSHYAKQLIIGICANTVNNVSAYALYDILTRFQLGKGRYNSFLHCVKDITLFPLGQEYFFGDRGILSKESKKVYATSQILTRQRLISLSRDRSFLSHLLFDEDQAIREQSAFRLEVLRDEGNNYTSLITTVVGR